MKLKRAILAFCVLGVLLSPAWAEREGPLTSEQVRDFIETRMAVARLQHDIRSRPGEFDDMVQAFFERRAELLESRGWTVEGFDAVKERVHAARSGIREAEALVERQADERALIREMEATGNFSDEQLAEMRQSLDQANAQQQGWIDETRPDWPAVERWLEELDAMTEWVAGNTDTPPSL